ncbi:DUF6883 domain-containing protein, partial [Bacillus cereus group sp. BC232]|uniref:DUF6883 domain-containing protein n=1 Tax=Bacillus cereus group sp. BC232 TaxID=3445338 RepID=UPI003F25A54C
FLPEQWEVFEQALLVHADTNPVATVRHSGKGYGDLYQVDCTLAMPDGSQACIRSVWEIRADDPRPRLITAHPNG